MKLRSLWPEVASTMRSIRGRGKLSFRQAQLTSVKSMQSRHFSFTSSLIAFCLFGVKLLLFCLIGLKEGLTFSLWVMTAGSILPMSSYFKANTFTFCFKKWMRRSLTSSASLDPM